MSALVGSMRYVVKYYFVIFPDMGTTTVTTEYLIFPDMSTTTETTPYCVMGTGTE
jgi:hypothetical protein